MKALRTKKPVSNEMGICIGLFIVLSGVLAGITIAYGLHLL